MVPLPVMTLRLMQILGTLHHAEKSWKTFDSLMQSILGALMQRIGRWHFVAQQHQKIPAAFAQMASPLLKTFSHLGMGTLAGKNIDTLMLIETESNACSKIGPYYKVMCCPNVTVTTSIADEETSTAATTTVSTSNMTTLTTEDFASTASTSSNATFTSAKGDSKTTRMTATVVPSTEPIPLGAVTVFEFGGFAFILCVSAQLSFAFV
jgi:hypothetical protein